jgi:hypothetical protein
LFIAPSIASPYEPDFFQEAGVHGVLETPHPSSVDTPLVFVLIVQDQVEIPDNQPCPRNMAMDMYQLVFVARKTRFQS